MAMVHGSEARGSDLPIGAVRAHGAQRGSRSKRPGPRDMAGHASVCMNVMN